MFRNINFRSFVKNQQGVVVIEFAFVFIVMTAILAFMADSMQKQAIKGKLDRTTYSVASILRERTAFYHSEEKMTQNQVNQLSRLVTKLLPANTEFGMQVELLPFLPQQYKRIDQPQMFSAGTGSIQCIPGKPLEQIQNLSPKSHLRWMPLYRVTLCLPVGTVISGIAGTANIQSSVIMLSRKQDGPS